MMQWELQVLKMIKGVGAFVGLFLLGTVGFANASTLDYAFTFTGTAFSGSGDISVNSAQDTLGGYDITAISGSILGPSSGCSPNSCSITNLDTQRNTPNATGLFTDRATGRQWLYNDVLFTSGAVPFDNNGVLFSFGGTSQYIANLYSVGTQLYLSVSDPVSYFDPGDSINLTVAQTPLPTAALLFGSALGCFALFGWRRNRKGLAFAAT